MEYQADKLRDAFDYDPATGILTNRVSRVCAREGARSGYFDKSSGYRRLSLGGRDVLEHRVIFAWVNGRWPTLEIDHINGDPTDNRISNLRECTHKQNCANTRTKKPGKARGVYWHKDRRKWQAIVRDGQRNKYLGLFTDKQAAIAAYNAAARPILGEFFLESKDGI